VLLIDANMRDPSIHELLGLPWSPGLTDVLQDASSLDHAVRPVPEFGSLHVLTAGTPVSRPADLAASPAMADLLQTAFGWYDTVVLDSPPVLNSADASALASHPGTGLIMVVNRASSRRPVVVGLRRLARAETKVLGIVVNRERRSPTEGYG
jgi:Mrp family chromosome partitioning ATPase